MRQDIAFATEVLADAVERRRNRTRLQNGLTIRAQLISALSKGQVPDHYRYRWLKDSGDKLLDAATKLCVEFSGTYPDDEASTLDLIDVLEIALTKAHERHNSAVAAIGVPLTS